MNDRDTFSIAESLSQQWRALPKNRRAAHTRLNPEQESFTRHLAAQLTDANITSVTQNAFEQQLARESARVLVYEDRELLDHALEYVPLGQLYEDAEDDLENHPDWGLEDVVIIKLLQWFKSFFSWVDQPACQFCSSKTASVGLTRPSFDDIKHGATTVELYSCQQCHRTTRFPRYNDPAKLFETRRGRCGEWANGFTLCCRAVGVEARYVLDTTDHVWTEIYSQTQQRWVHCDPCENAFDRPLLYSAGWGKALSYCIAFSAEEAVDVTKRYTTNWPVVLSRRRAISEPHLFLVLHNLTQKRYRALLPTRVEELDQRRALEEKELIRLNQRVSARDDELVGRISGSLGWRLARKEINNAKEVDGELVSTLSAFKHMPTVEALPFSLQGSASIHTEACSTTRGIANECIQLTPAMTDQVGSAFLRNKISLDKHEGVAIDFAFKIANQHDGKADGADGMAFVIQSSAETALGQGGCELGYGGIRKSIAIEFDTYDSSDRCDDPSGNHISVHGRLPPYSNSAHHMYSHGHTSKLPPMNSGTWFYVRIHLLFKQNVIAVAFSDEGDEQSGIGTKLEYVLTIKNINIRQYLGEDAEAWIGFTASTGGLFQSHQIKLGSVSVLMRD